ncbi:MAG: hypothetical protein ABSF24_11470 [Candidatus Bathyarchaeia archaeon]
MGKKVTVLVTVCFMIIVAVFFEFFVFRTPVQQTISVDEIASSPSAWLNRTVLVEGNMSGPSLFLQPEMFSPWQYNLTSASAHIGVFWSTGVALNGSVPVKVYGVIKEVTVFSSLQPPVSSIVYYVNAEKVELV